MSIIVPITRPALGQAEADAITRVLRSGWIMQGPEVAEFEKEFATVVGAEHAVAVANGTVALELALRALGVAAGDDVVTVSHSFIATANAVVAVGARPIFVDVREDDFNLDPTHLKEALTPKTQAVICVHQLGFPCDLAAIRAAIPDDLPIIEDAACAAGSQILLDGRWQRLGRPHSAIATFSFHPRKVITTGEGGMLTVARPKLAERLRRLRQHGADGESFVEPASNHRLTDLQAAIGRTQLARLDAVIAERRRLADRLGQALVGHPILTAPVERPGIQTNWQSYPCRVKPPVTQAQVIKFLGDSGISTRAGLTNAHEEPAYSGSQRFAVAPGGLVVSERLRATTVMLPLFHGMTESEAAAVVEALDKLRDLH